MCERLTSMPSWAHAVAAAAPDHVTATSSDQPASGAAGKKKREVEEEEDDRASIVELERRQAAAGKDGVRERLKRHRSGMAGRVRIPEMWEQERLLKEWVVDRGVFDRPLAGLLTARDALVAHCAAPRRPPHHGHGRPLRVHNGCS